MLSAEGNALLCRIENHAPMGRMIRRYWIAAALSQEMEADGAPQRVRLMGPSSAIVWFGLPPAAPGSRLHSLSPNRASTRRVSQ